VWDTIKLVQTRVQAHVSYKILYHLVFIPKFRHNLLVNNVGEYCEKVIKTVISDEYEDVIIEEINVAVDHVHILIIIPPKYSISSVVGKIKANSSRIMRKQFYYLRRGRDALWSVGYFISTVGLNETIIRNYVKYQKEQDKGQITNF
jgi:putative transposase